MGCCSSGIKFVEDGNTFHLVVNGVETKTFFEKNIQTRKIIQLKNYTCLIVNTTLYVLIGNSLDKVHRFNHPIDNYQIIGNFIFFNHDNKIIILNGQKLHENCYYKIFNDRLIIFDVKSLSLNTYEIKDGNLVCCPENYKLVADRIYKEYKEYSGSRYLIIHNDKIYYCSDAEEIAILTDQNIEIINKLLESSK